MNTELTSTKLTSTKLTSTCLQKAADNEPIFVLRAQDNFSPHVIDIWATLAASTLGRDHPKVLSAYALADEMRKWGFRKNPD